MKPENGIFKIYVKHRIENKILYQMHFLVFDLKIPWRNILRIIKKNPAEFPMKFHRTWWFSWEGGNEHANRVIIYISGMRPGRIVDH